MMFIFRLIILKVYMLNVQKTHSRSVFCGREELLFVQTFGFLTFYTFYMHKNL